MTLRLIASVILASLLTIVSVGCRAPGKPKPGLTEEMIRPDQVTDFNALYSQNCAACHGDHGRNGAAVSLANPIYLAFAGAQNLHLVTSNGVAGTMMPGFVKSAGGMLTEQQITLITEGMIKTWGNATDLNQQSPLKYASSLTGDPSHGQTAFASYCARCHGPDAAGSFGKEKLGSLVDPAYLSLISDQGLRTIIVAGKPEQGMPDYRSYPGQVVHGQAVPGQALTHQVSTHQASSYQAVTDQEITDIVSWLVSHRTATPGQIYRQHP